MSVVTLNKFSHCVPRNHFRIQLLHLEYINSLTGQLLSFAYRVATQKTVHVASNFGTASPKTVRAAQPFHLSNLNYTISIGLN